MSCDTLEDLKEDLCALLSYFDDNIFSHQHMEVRQKLDRTISMIEQLGKNDSKEMLAAKIGSDISALLQWFQGAAAYQDRYVHDHK